jgi:hypothetical protein
MAQKSNSTNSINERKQMAPGFDMPARNQDFSDSGNQAQYSGQMKPAFVNKDGKKITNSVPLNGNQKPQKFSNAGTFDLDAIFNPEDTDTDAPSAGYGTPTTGIYSVAQKGYHSFGSIGQGNDTQGLDGQHIHCDNRTIMVTVTATAPQGSDTLLLQVGSYSFQTL